MKKFLLFGLLALTTPDGNRIWIAHDSIDIVKPAGYPCAPLSHSELFVGAGSYCVREQAADIVRRIKDEDKE